MGGDNKELGASRLAADRATRASPQAPAGLGHSASIADAGMPVISMWQPFASLVFEWDRDKGEFAKAFETRGFKLPSRLIGQEVAIHATAKFPAAKHISEALNDYCYQLWGCGYNYSLPFGAIIGIVRFGAPIPTGEEAPFQPDTEIAAGDWSPGRWAWPIMSAEKLAEPIPMKGKQGWWRVPAQAIETAKPPRREAGSARKGESPVSREADAPTPSGQNISDVLIEALESIRLYANDTLSGRADGPADAAWFREGIVELRNRSRDALRQAKGGEG